MVAPIAGPKNRSKVRIAYHPIYGWPYETGRETRIWYTQAKPYTSPLPFSMEGKYVVRVGGASIFYKTVSDVPGVGLAADFEIQALYNKGYENFMGNVKSAQADVMTLMRERQKSLSMIQKRALDIALFVQAARQRRKDLMRSVIRNAYGLSDPRRKTVVGLRKHAKLNGGLVLEGSFGWAPLAADLSSAVSVFRNGPPAGHVSGGAKGTFRSIYRTEGDPSETVISTENVGWKLRSVVRCVDSDLYLLNSLGLVNVASSLWETTPWSFAFDYLINVQTFLNSFTDRLGLEFEGASSTLFRVRNTSVTYTDGPSGPSFYGGWPNYTGQSVSVNRSLGISRPTLAWRSPWSLSPQRAMTSIALLLQKLKG